MKKIIIIIGSLLLILPSKGFSQGDAAAITSFLAPYMAALKVVSESTGMSIDDIKTATQKAIKITNDIVKTYSSSIDMVEMGSSTKNIYVEYLDGIQYLYENNLYFTGDETKDLLKMLDYAAFGYIASSINRPKGINSVAGGALTTLPTILKAQSEGGNSTLKEINDLMNDTKIRIRKSLSDTRTVNRYMEGIVRKKQYELGMRDVNIHKQKIIKKYGLK